jgi:hypothetical protein
VSSLQFSATSYVVNESAGAISIGVTRFGNTANAATINYTTSNGSATQPNDYASASGSLQFAPGETVKTLVVPIVDDGVVERTESFNLVLSAPGAGAMEGSPFTTTVTILDDDKPLLLTQENTPRAAALDSVTMMREPFPIGTIHNFSSDNRTRIMLFATGIELLPSETFSDVVVHLETGNQTFSLLVEDIRKVPNFDSISQIVVKLPGSPDFEGDAQISLTFRGVTGNKPLIALIH